MRIYSHAKELARAPAWRLRANPNPWGVQLAFDNTPVTRWRSWHKLFPGMFLEVDFGRAESVDMVVLEASRDEYQVRLRLEGQGADGKWTGWRRRRGRRRSAATRPPACRHRGAESGRDCLPVL